MKYNLPPLEMIKLLGCTHPTGREWLEYLKRENQVLLPKTYYDFIEYAAGCPLFATSDLWVGRTLPLARTPRMFHAQLLEDMDARKECRSNYERDLSRLEQLPREQWPEDYLLIGSDYVHDTGYFGIRRADLSQDDPPVCWRRSGDSCSKWQPEYKSLSDFLRRILADVLSCNDYDTAKEALQEMGWKYEEDINIQKDSRTGSKAFLWKQGISFLRLKKYDSPSGVKVYCCYDEGKNVFYTGIVDEGEVLLSAIRRREGVSHNK